MIEVVAAIALVVLAITWPAIPRWWHRRQCYFCRTRRPVAFPEHTPWP